MTDSDYSGRTLTLGTIIGERFWDLDINGRLHPLTIASGTVWGAGVNNAVCHGSKSHKHFGFDEYPTYGTDEYKEMASLQMEWKANHDMSDCEHGFYGLFAGEAESFYGADRADVRGIIEGTGEVLIGSKGFRAMQARILALAVEPKKGMWNLDEFFVRRLKANYPNAPVFESVAAMHAEFPPHRAEDHIRDDDMDKIEEVA